MEQGRLRPQRSRSTATAGHAFRWSFSPDRSRLAAGGDSTGELRLYDLRRLRVLGDVTLLRPSGRGLAFASACPPCATNVLSASPASLPPLQ